MNYNNLINYLFSELLLIECLQIRIKFKSQEMDQFMASQLDKSKAKPSIVNSS